jgi:hypothetical protein
LKEGVWGKGSGGGAWEKGSEGKGSEGRGLGALSPENFSDWNGGVAFPIDPPSSPGEERGSNFPTETPVFQLRLQFSN